jgi:DNA polymerase III delta prime subunit
MTTVGEAVVTLQQSLVLDRGVGIASFRNWLDDRGGPELLNVSGPPGVGKTTLLEAFAREANSLGINIAIADGHGFRATPQGLVLMLGAGRSSTIHELIAQLNADQSLVLIDTFEQLQHLTGYLQQELLPHLDTGVKVVIAGRRPLVLAWGRADGWPKIVRLLPLDGFTADESRRYLERRGLACNDLIDQVVSATAGNPLALSLAADIVMQFGLQDFAGNSQWRLAARSLVRRLLSEATDDPPLMTVLEACSVVRVFDEATLAAIAGQDDVTREFDRLCRLSIVKPAAHGLMLHDHIRTIIAKDLAWRRPHYHQLLRKRALEHFRGLLRDCTQAEREWLIAECFHLLGDPLVHDVFFGSHASENVAVSVARDIDRASLNELFLRTAPADSALDADSQLLAEVLRYPETRVRVAKNGDGVPVGFSTVVPVCRESIPFLERHPRHARLLNAYFVPLRRKSLPATADRATAHYLLHVAATGTTAQATAVRSALLRELGAIFGLGGTYLSSTALPLLNQLLEACGFELLSGSPDDANGWVLDLTRIGFDGWIETIMDGKPSNVRPDTAQLDSELLGALAHWNDSQWLATNCPIISGALPPMDRAEAVRETIDEALTRARAKGSNTMERAYRAVELGYMKQSAGQKQAMRSLAVSRATFYRLCKRGVWAIAEECSADLRRKARI